MGLLQNFLDHCRENRDQMRDDDTFWRANNWRLFKNGEDITEERFSDRERRIGLLSRLLGE